MHFFKVNQTIHTSRTLMFNEISKVMDHGSVNEEYTVSLHDNIVNKRTKSNQEKTNRYLKTLYKLDINYLPFKCFKEFWNRCEDDDRRTLALLYAISGDILLRESIDVTKQAVMNKKLASKAYKENVEEKHPGRYSENTKASIARNLISSWKQAGYIAGKINSIRIPKAPSYHTVSFALLMSYLNGERGDFLLASKWVQALDATESQIRELTFEASKRDLLQYQHTGNVTVISFSPLFHKLELHGVQN